MLISKIHFILIFVLWSHNHKGKMDKKGGGRALKCYWYLIKYGTYVKPMLCTDVTGGTFV